MDSKIQYNGEGHLQRPNAGHARDLPRAPAADPPAPAIFAGSFGYFISDSAPLLLPSIAFLIAGGLVAASALVAWQDAPEPANAIEPPVEPECPPSSMTGQVRALVRWCARPFAASLSPVIPAQAGIQ